MAAIPRVSTSTSGTPAESSPPSETQKTQNVGTTHLCHSCNNPEAEKLCGRCLLVYYCSTQCQKSDWPEHKRSCKPPLMTRVQIATGNLGEKRQNYDVPQKVWGKDQIEASQKRGPIRKTGFAESKTAQRVMADFKWGEMTHTTHSGDAVSFSGTFFDRQTLLQLKKDYHGLLLAPLASLVDEENYVEILKFVWTEQDLNYILEALKPYAEKGHTILMLEYSRTVCRKMEKQKNYPAAEMEQAFKWYALGMAHAEMDITCCSDPSVEDALGMLRYHYTLERFIPAEKLNAFMLNSNWPKFVAKTLKEYQFPSELPTPVWVMYHGLYILGGKNTMKPSEKWMELRAQQFQALKDRVPVTS